MKPNGSAVEMGVFFFIDDRLINLDDPTAMVKDEYHERFARKEFAPFILSEICALDMLYSCRHEGRILRGKAQPEGRTVCQEHRAPGRPPVLV